MLTGLLSAASEGLWWGDKWLHRPALLLHLYHFYAFHARFKNKKAPPTSRGTKRDEYLMLVFVYVLTSPDCLPGYRLIYIGQREISGASYLVCFYIRRQNRTLSWSWFREKNVLLIIYMWTCCTLSGTRSHLDTHARDAMSYWTRQTCAYGELCQSTASVCVTGIWWCMRGLKVSL